MEHARDAPSVSWSWSVPGVRGGEQALSRLTVEVVGVRDGVARCATLEVPPGTTLRGAAERARPPGAGVELADAAGQMLL